MYPIFYMFKNSRLKKLIDYRCFFNCKTVFIYEGESENKFLLASENRGVHESQTV